MKKRKILILIGILLAVTGLGLRIWYVNTHTYSPEIREVPQGQTAEYCGLSYTMPRCGTAQISIHSIQSLPIIRIRTYLQMR